MFGWFKKKPKEAPEVPKLIEDMFRPLSLAAAVSKIISEYQQDVRSGEISAPAYQRKDESVIGIWRDTRLEALSNLWDYGSSEPGTLANHRQQMDLLNVFFIDKPQFAFPLSPTGEKAHDTLQAVFRVYIYLGEIGSAIMDRESCRDTLKLAGKTIFSNLEIEAAKLWEAWKSFNVTLQPPGELSRMPPTLFEVIYADVTAKAKSIALSSKFGPSYEDGMQSMVSMIQTKMKANDDSDTEISKAVQGMRALMDEILAANDPDHFSE